MKKPSCLNPECSFHGNVESRCIIRYGFYRTTAGKRRRYRCIKCGQPFSTTKGTPYYRLQHRRTGIVNLSRIGLTDPQYTGFTTGHKPIILGVDQPSFR